MQLTNILGLAFIAIFIILPFWKIFVKAGQPGWAALIPIYNVVVLLRITSMPLWTILLFCIPVVNVCFAIYLLYELAMAFGKGIGFTLGLVVLPFIFLPILAFDNNRYYATNVPMSPEEINRLFWLALKKGGDTTFVEYLLDKGADVDMRGENGETLLMWAAHKGYIQTVTFLLQYGADINARDNHGNTPLMYAAMEKQLDMMEFLLKGSISAK